MNSSERPPLIEVTPVANHHFLHHVVDRSGIDTHASHRHLAGFARAVVIDLQDVACLHDEGLFEPREAEVVGELGVLRKLAELAMNRHEIARAHQVQHQRWSAAEQLDGVRPLRHIRN